MRDWLQHIAARFGAFFWVAMSVFQRPNKHLKRQAQSRWHGAVPDANPPVALYLAVRRRDLKMRVVFATVLLFAAKLATSRCRSPSNGRPTRWPATAPRRVAPDNWLAWALAAPVMMTLAYGGMRIVMALLTQWRDGIFAKVAMNAVRRLAISPSSTCTCCRCAFISSARPAG